MKKNKPWMLFEEGWHLGLVSSCIIKGNFGRFNIISSWDKVWCDACSNKITSHYYLIDNEYRHTPKYNIRLLWCPKCDVLIKNSAIFAYMKQEAILEAL